MYPSPPINHHATAATAPTQPNSDTQNIYFEKQEKSRCMIHSINMFVGHRWLDAHAVADFCDTVKTVPNWSQAWSTTSGSMNVDAMNYYLMHNTTPGIGNNKELKFLNTIMNAGNSKEQWLQAIGDRPEVILHWNDPGHAVCLKKCNDEWYLLDSEAPENRLCMERAPGSPPRSHYT